MMIRMVLGTAALVLVCALVGAFALGVAAGKMGAELGAIAGVMLGLAIAFRYCADMASVAEARRKIDMAQSIEARLSRHKQGLSAPVNHGYLRDRTSEIWQTLAPKNQGRQSLHGQYTSQRHHDLALSDIGIRRKSKRKRQTGVIPPGL